MAASPSRRNPNFGKDLVAYLRTLPRDGDDARPPKRPKRAPE